VLALGALGGRLGLVRGKPGGGLGAAGGFVLALLLADGGQARALGVSQGWHTILRPPVGRHKTIDVGLWVGGLPPVSRPVRGGGSVDALVLGQDIRRQPAAADGAFAVKGFRCHHAALRRFASARAALTLGRWVLQYVAQHSLHVR
jgi:hypothetical protein